MPLARHQQWNENIVLAVLASRRTDRFYFAIEETVRLRFKRFRADKTSACFRVNQAALHNALRAIRAAGLLASAFLCLINSPFWGNFS